MTELQDNLPPGWDCKVDEKTGKYYYINHFTRSTTWDDPRNRHRPFPGTPKHFSNMQVEHIPLQHGSPDLRRNYVYPSQTSPIPAFQMPANQSPKSIHLQDFKNISQLNCRGVKVQDTTLSVASDTEDVGVGKIAAMFPTVSETHIRLLMKKYHSREALVISALQVEKYPITTPGPFATPPPQRNIHHTGVFASKHMTPPLGLCRSSRGGSPIFLPGSATTTTYTGSPRLGDAYRSSPKPHSSPKLKLRYMKSIFPQADETVILDVLQNHDNNIQKTSDALKELGFSKKDTVKVAQENIEIKKEQLRQQEELKNRKVPSPKLKIKTAEEKTKMKEKLQERYKAVADHLITIAMESVDFDEDRANQILQIMVQEDQETSTSRQVETADHDEIDTAVEVCADVPLPISHSKQSLKSLQKTDKTKDKGEMLFSRAIVENGDDITSKHLSSTNGPNPILNKGPNEKLLLEDYVKWQGSNTNFRRGSQSLAKGPNLSLLSVRPYSSCGPNSELRKGPKFGLAKGSIFSQLKTVVVGDSRAK